MTIASPADLAFPVLCLPMQGGPGLAYRLPELCTVRSSVLRAGFYRDLQVVDSSGRSYAVVAATLSGSVRRWIAAILDLRLRVNLELESIEPIALTLLRERVLLSMAEEPDELEEHTGRPLDWWRPYLDQADSSGDFVRRYASGVRAG